MESNEQTKITFDDLINAAQKECWDFVDKNLLTLCNMPENIEWALQKGINNEDGNLRDLAVSILEKSDYKLSENNLKTLQKLLETDENLYVRFRAAFALFNKGDKSEIVIKKLKEACENEDVKEIAEKYLDKLKS